jgi:uncharacterized protein (DUF885 family)/pimeloyl-ACP methyl ester carboxylesterase
MSTRYVKTTIAVVILLTSIVGCGKSKSTHTPVPTATPIPPTYTPIPPTATERPTETLPPPAATVAPATAPPSSEIKGQVDIGSHELFIHCVGTGTPTVVMEAGWDDVGETWSLVQPEVAKFTRACVYDRAGLGHSEPGPAPRDIPRVVAELKALLEAAGVEGPYVLVGHSWGGVYVRLYADLYQEDVVGLVLVDGSHPDMFRRSLAVLPPESPDDGESLKFYRNWFTGSADDPTLKLDPRLLEAGSLGDLPLVVLTSPRKQRADDFSVELSEKFDEIWVELQRELAQLSSNGTHVIVEESGHFIQHEQPGQVVEAILHVIEQAASVPTALAPTPTPVLEATPEHSPNADILASLQGLPIDEFFEQSFHQLALRDPDALVWEGLADQYGVANDRFTDISEAYVRETQQLESALLDLLHTYDRAALSPEQQLSYDTYEWYLDDRVRGHAFAYHDYPVNSMPLVSVDFVMIDFMAEILPVTNKQDAEDYVARLSEFDTWMAQLLEGLKLREQAGVIPPRSMVASSVTQIREHLQMQGTDDYQVREIELYTAFRDKLEQIEGISAEEKQALLDAAEAEIENTVVPAYLELKAYMAHLRSIATDDVGLWKLPNGEAYYAHLLRHHTTTDMSADEIHALGLDEVARLKAELQALAHAELGASPDISTAELNELIWSQSEYLEGEVLLAEFQSLLDEVKQISRDYFDLFPRADVVIKFDPLASVNYYSSPAADGSRPGTYFVAGGMPGAMVPGVLYHEAIPGHHVTSLELDLPAFRRFTGNSAYGEGWALYAERLAWEMGLYEDNPPGNLARLQLELMRAARLVVDTGLNAQGWTWDEATSYMGRTLGFPEYPTEALVRFVALPGQGCAYTIGYLKILELRQRAMERLGAQFDIKAFHNVVLGSGNVPLDILERLVNAWIEESAPPSPTSEPAPDLPPAVVAIVAQLQGLPLDEFFEESNNQLLLRDPEALTSMGLSESFGLRNDQLTDLSDAYVRETQALERAILDLLRTYDREALTPEQQVSYDVYEWILDNQVRGHQFMYHDYPLHHFLRSYDFSLDSLFTTTHPFEDRQDVEDYIARLSRVSRQVEQLLEGLVLREEMGIVPPRFIVEFTRGNLLGYLQVRSPDPSAVNPRALEVYTRLDQALETMDDLSAAEKQTFLDAAQAQIEASFVPAYLKMIEYQDHLLTIASDDAGAWKLPDGDAYYAYMLRQETSTDLSPQEVHEIGLAEVARIQAEMRALFGQLGYSQDESLGTLINRAIEDAGNYDAFTPAGKDQVVAAYEALLEEVDRHLDAMFDIRPRTQAIIVGDSSFGGGGGYYEPGAMDGSRPGAFHTGIGDSWVARYRMPTTLYHEAVPGHHFQIAIAQELDLPAFRNGVIFNGYAEGWALYAERLAWELGLYDDDPYGNLGRLHMELLRAVRLVADTGLHAMGWTREQTRAYVDEALGTPGRFSHEVDRYVVLPAQATGYKIGMIKLLELRELAMDQLGEQFDIREFHNVVLGNGSLPLEILERIVQEYIASKGTGG